MPLAKSCGVPSSPTKCRSGPIPFMNRLLPVSVPTSFAPLPSLTLFSVSTEPVPSVEALADEGRVGAHPVHEQVAARQRADVVRAAAVVEDVQRVDRARVVRG